MDESDCGNQIDDLTLAIMDEDEKKLKEVIGKLKSFADPCWMYGYRPLCIAYKNGKYNTAKTILELDFFIQVNNNSEKKLNTPLHWALLHDMAIYRSKNIKKLLKSGADMNAENSQRQNAFDIALQKKELSLLKLLVDNISDDNIKESTYIRLLSDLITEYYNDLTAQLLEKCLHIDIEQSMSDTHFLVVAVEKRQYNVVIRLLDRGVNIDYYEKLNENSVTALYKACEIGDLAMVKYLLDKGANIDWEKQAFEDRSRYYPIHVAIKNCHLKVVKELLNRGVDVNKTFIERSYNKTECEITALQLACQYCTTGIVKLLVDRGADIHRANKDGYTPICEIFPDETDEEQYLDAYRYFFSLKNLRLDLKAAKHILFWCAELDQPKKLPPLFQYIDRLDPKDYLRYEIYTKLFNNANLPIPLIHTAARNAANECIDIFVNNAIDVNLRNKKMRTSLHLAFRYRKLCSIESLIRNGASIDLVCDEDHLPIEYAFVDKIRESRFSDDDNNGSCETSYDFWEDDIGDIMEYYGYYVMKLKHLNLFMNETNFNITVSYLDNPFDNEEKYDKEVKKMKRKIISDDIPYITYYDFVKASSNCRINCLNNPQILDILSSQVNYYETFPEFADIFSNLFHQALARKKLLDKFYECPIFKFLNENLAYLCVKEIVDYFSNNDLKNVINQYTFFA